ncbi:MAG: flagellar basal-body rod protein FlgF [Deltaproteobacteria bacterium]
MQAGLYIAFTGARGAEKRMDRIANNLANVSSTGYKQDKVSQSGVAPAGGGPDVPGPAEGGLLYSAPSAPYLDLSPGTIRHTGNPLDLSIDGPGFFVVRTPEGLRLTRAGNFRIDADGDLATSLGGKVLGEGGGAIHLGEGRIAVGRDGQVSVDDAPVGVLDLRRVPDPRLLRKEGSNLFSATAWEALLPAGPETTVHAGSLEESNVSAVSMMTEMVEASRMFEAYMRMMTTISELTSKAAGDLGRV